MTYNKNFKNKKNPENRKDFKKREIVKPLIPKIQKLMGFRLPIEVVGNTYAVKIALGKEFGRMVFSNKRIGRGFEDFTCDFKEPQTEFASYKDHVYVERDDLIVDYYKVTEREGTDEPDEYYKVNIYKVKAFYNDLDTRESFIQLQRYNNCTVRGNRVISSAIWDDEPYETYNNILIEITKRVLE